MTLLDACEGKETITCRACETSFTYDESLDDMAADGEGRGGSGPRVDPIGRAAQLGYIGWIHICASIVFIHLRRHSPSSSGA